MGVGPAHASRRERQWLPPERGTAARLAWVPPGTGRQVAHPGQARHQPPRRTKGKIECDVDDDGALSIPASLTDALTDLGIAGFPTVMVTRSAIGSTRTALGRVDLRIYGYAEVAVLIPGLISCTDDSECAGGKVCRDDKTCS